MKSKYKELKAQLEKLAQETEAAREQEVKEVAARVVAELNEYQVSLADLVAAGFKVSAAEKPTKASTKKPQSAATGVVKYKDPSNPQNIWSGKGRPPKWLTEQEAAGKSRESFQI